MTPAEAYAKVPEVNCKGLCAAYCGPIGLAPVELVQLRLAAGKRLRVVPLGPNTVTLVPRPDGSCHLLKKNRCSAYAARPLICRLFGAAEGLRCPHGCRPTGPLLTRGEVAALVHSLGAR